jgi:hypothetical protein
MADSTTPLRDLVQATLATKVIPFERFKDIVQRLYAAGTLVRDEDGVERTLYDEACRLEDLLADYFSLAGFRLVHERRGQFFRLYPPGAQIPGYPDVEDEPVPSLRARLSADFVAAALALRFLYQQGLTTAGAKLNEMGELRVRLEDLAATMLTQIHFPMPSTVTERTALLASLRRHRLISMSSEFSMAEEEASLLIRPTILGIVSEDAMSAALEAEGAPEGATAVPVALAEAEAGATVDTEELPESIEIAVTAMAEPVFVVEADDVELAAQRLEDELLEDSLDELTRRALSDDDEEAAA